MSSKVFAVCDKKHHVGLASSYSRIRSGLPAGDLIRSISTDIVIAAAPEQVWAQLIDLPRWADWNPFIREIAGDPAVGSRLRVVLQPPGSSRATTFRPTVVAHVLGERFEWLGTVGTSGIADGHHIFELEPAGEGKTRFVQREEFTGWAVGLLWPLFRKAEPGFVAMNQTIKSAPKRKGKPDPHLIGVRSEDVYEKSDYEQDAHDRPDDAASHARPSFLGVDIVGTADTSREARASGRRCAQALGPYPGSSYTPGPPRSSSF